MGMLIFGLSKSYTQAVIGRCIAGLLNGNIGVVKSFLTEITDDSNRGAAFSYMSVAWALGTILGPLIGGLLCRPAITYPNIFGNNLFFIEYPYFLPVLVCCIGNLISALMAYCYMTETRVVTTHCCSNSNSDSSSNIDSNIIELKVIDNKNNTYSKVDEEEEEEEDVTQSPLILDDDLEAATTDNESNDETNNSNYTNEVTKILQDNLDAGTDDDDDQSFYEEYQLCSCNNNNSDSKNSKNSKNSKEQVPILKQKIVILTTFNYGLLAMAYIILEETIPLFLKLSTQEGGFGLSSSAIGFILSISGGVMLLFTFFILPKLASKSKLWMFRIGIYYAIPLAFGWPLLAVLEHEYLLKNKYKFLISRSLLVLVSVLKSVFSCMSFTAVTIQINHSCYDENLGAVNGLGQSFASLSRCIGPALGGLLWSISIKKHFIFTNFISVGIILLWCLYVSFLLPKSIDYKRKNTKNHPYNTVSAVETDSNLVMH
jgi:MFS family permease